MYEEKKKHYEIVKNRLFCNEIGLSKAPISRRIMKARERYNIRKQIRNEVESSVLESNQDIRPYGTVEIFNLLKIVI